MTRPVWTDNHCHLKPETAAQEVEAAAANGVERLINIGTDLTTSRQAIEVANQFGDTTQPNDTAQSNATSSNVFATVGVHPHDAKDHNTPEALAELEAMLSEKKVIAVGECGLDFYYDHSERDIQREVFASQIQLAKNYSLPLVIHSRDAWAETFEVLDEVGAPDSTIFHCFTGGPAEVAEIKKRGGYISFSGVLTFKNAPEVREAAKLFVPESVLVETDVPFLSPEPHRGKTNTPANLVFVGKKLSEVMGVPFNELASQTWENTSRAYAI